MILFRNKISYYFPHPLIVMNQLYFLIVWLITSGIYVFSVSAYGIDDNRLPTLSTDIISANKDPINILTLVQVVLLKVLLPVVVVGASLYIAYELFTAEGDETKLKKAWKSVAYTAIALIAIALSYAIVSIISGLSF